MKILKNIIIFLTLITWHIPVHCQIGLLDKYNFEDGGFVLLGTPSESDRNELAEELGEFYTDDPNVLNEIKKEWIFKKKCPHHSCGSHYAVYICRNAKWLDRFFINLNCKAIVTDEEDYYFDEIKLSIFKDKFKKYYRYVMTTTSLIDARFYAASILKESALLMTSNPDGIVYEGDFSFIVKNEIKFNPKDRKSFSRTKNSFINELIRMIQSAYPGEKFELQLKSCIFPEKIVKITCNKTLADIFNLFPIKSNWKPFKVHRIVTYWKFERPLREHNKSLNAEPDRLSGG